MAFHTAVPAACGSESLKLKMTALAGAAQTRKEWLLFMHADCQLPQGYFESMRNALEHHGESKQPVWGCFCTLETGLPSMKLVQWGIRMRTWLRGQPYGDQGLFCSSRAFQVCSPHASVVACRAKLLFHSSRPST